MLSSVFSRHWRDCVKGDIIPLSRILSELKYFEETHISFYERYDKFDLRLDITKSKHTYDINEIIHSIVASHTEQ